MHNYHFGQNSIAPGIVIPGYFDSDALNLKEPGNAFNVYVNEVYVGDKELVADGDGGINSVKEYLKGQGFKDFEYKAYGKNIYIKTSDERGAKNMVNYLKVYLNIR